MGTKITLRRKPITRGRESLYLEFYPAIRCPETMKMIYKEYLGIYIFQNPQNLIQKEYNDEMLLKAEGIRSMRVQAVINEQYGFLDKHKLKGDFLAFFRSVVARKDPKWRMVYRHFERFAGGKCTYGEVTVELCRKFREYLTTTHQLKFTKKKMRRNSAASYFSTFRALLKVAYRDKLIRENVNDFLEKLEYEDTRREFLTLDELKRLADTPCDIPMLRRAAIFSCFTGLRISDILQLEWKDISQASDGGWWMRIRTEKTETEATLPISDEALEYCGTPGTGKVFAGLERSMTQHPLFKWIRKAGIERHITFHCFRHTFATLQIALGTDIFTVSKMLTHRNVSTTQIYAELVNEKKRESANKISLK
ncbi:site-specific integrase [Alistipes provencensis]|uniref:site-specific integrase n=1 Tax=Alistipes provencensis TaxID=1816676 RepID=UPI0007EDA2FC|nr:site-specific integrase [Alistipes provencensis]